MALRWLPSCTVTFLPLRQAWTSLGWDLTAGIKKPPGPFGHLSACFLSECATQEAHPEATVPMANLCPALSGGWRHLSSMPSHVGQRMTVILLRGNRHKQMEWGYTKQNCFTASNFRLSGGPFQPSPTISSQPTGKAIAQSGGWLYGYELAQGSRVSMCSCTHVCEQLTGQIMGTCKLLSPNFPFSL